MRKLILTVLFLSALSAGARQLTAKIAYNVLDDTATGNYEIYIMNADGSNQRNISNSTALEWVYASYNSRIYFISNRDTSCKPCYLLYEMDTEGKNVRKVSDLVMEDSWIDFNKEGTGIIVSARKGREVRHQLFLLNLNDGAYRQLTTDTTAYHNDPVFSPDGKTIVFRYKANRRDRSMKTELYSMNSDGTGLRQLSFYPAEDSSASSGEYHAGPPKWNAKENFISYMSFQKGKYQVFGITPDGKKQWQITHDELESGWHDWAADGRSMVVEMSAPKKYDIYLFDTKTSKRKQLTNSWKYEQAPVFVY